jgi:hypothetical protein
MRVLLALYNHNVIVKITNKCRINYNKILNLILIFTITLKKIHL